jgi:acyl carrier protein
MNDAEDNKYLVGYFTSREAIDTANLHHQLMDRLPQYMVPSFFIRLNELPLTANGKIDKKALMASPVNIEDKVRYVAPRNDTEAHLVRLWKELLGHEKNIGITHNFFESGGHSIKVVRLLSRISREFGITIRIQDFLESPTIEELAAKILNASWFASERNESITTTPGYDNASI